MIEVLGVSGHLPPPCQGSCRFSLEVELGARNADKDVTRPYSEAFKQKMVQRLIGKNAISARQLGRETGVNQECLSRWLLDARSLPKVMPEESNRKTWSLVEKARIIGASSDLKGDELMAFLQQEDVQLAELERWRLALEGRDMSPTMMTKRIRSLERELVRKEKALAEAAALLVLQKKVALLLSEDEDDDTDRRSGK